MPAGAGLTRRPPGQVPGSGRLGRPGTWTLSADDELNGAPIELGPVYAIRITTRPSCRGRCQRAAGNVWATGFRRRQSHIPSSAVLRRKARRQSAAGGAGGRRTGSAGARSRQDAAGRGLTGWAERRVAWRPVRDVGPAGTRFARSGGAGCGVAAPRNALDVLGRRDVATRHAVAHIGDGDAGLRTRGPGAEETLGAVAPRHRASASGRELIDLGHAGPGHRRSGVAADAADPVPAGGAARAGRSGRAHRLTLFRRGYAALRVTTVAGRARITGAGHTGAAPAERVLRSGAIAARALGVERTGSSVRPGPSRGADRRRIVVEEVVARVPGVRLCALFDEGRAIPGLWRRESIHASQGLLHHAVRLTAEGPHDVGARRALQIRTGKPLCTLSAGEILAGLHRRRRGAAACERAGDQQHRCAPKIRCFCHGHGFVVSLRDGRRSVGDESIGHLASGERNLGHSASRKRQSSVRPHDPTFKRKSRDQQKETRL